VVGGDGWSVSIDRRGDVVVHVSVSQRLPVNRQSDFSGHCMPTTVRIPLSHFAREVSKDEWTNET